MRKDSAVRLFGRCLLFANPLRAVFRVDASATIGGGHAMRCLALADALAAAGWRCGFACNEDALGLVPGLARHAVIPIVSGQDSISPIANAWRDNLDLLVVDHYGLGADFERAARPLTRRVLAIDDLCNREHDCDILLDHTLGRKTDHYAHLVPESCLILVGAEYAPLRPEFAARRAESLRRRALGTDLRCIFVSFGASDPFKLTARTLTALQRTGLDIEAHVVAGVGPDAAEVRRMAAASGNGWTVHGPDADIAKLLAEADLALGAPGTTSWERCCLGVPAILASFAYNQKDNADALTRAGAAVFLGPESEVTAERISAEISSLQRNPESLARMSRAAAQVCDGRGTSRLLTVLTTPQRNRSRVSGVNA